MSLRNECRNCQTPLSAEETPNRLCDECCYLAVDYRRYDDLREEGRMPYQAKLMCGLADPPDPDDE
ncbi:hypothetical protein MO767_22555 [Pseudomonas sp. UYIF39]|uniref:hypothetical protein n=1 Tax=Pseudomonas sp. UYIF39 TaxID=1630747 RepID=UPI00249E7299|nr:hypothetical protein [Pseudomonas sp. UYIF39]MDI3357110.1 hypothetical protein [Pseudomonas sp. UYIF39]